MIRQPSDLAPFYDYWRLALTDLEAANDLYWQQKEAEGYHNTEVMPVCGFFRKPVHMGWWPSVWEKNREYRCLDDWSWTGSLMIPVAIWLRQDIGGDGCLEGPEEYVVKVGRRVIDQRRAGFGYEITLEKARKNPVSQAAYEHAMRHGNWHDDGKRARERAGTVLDLAGEHAETRKPVVDVKDERSLF